MHKFDRVICLQTLLITIGLILPQAYAEKISDKQWQVKAGDTLYSVARTMLPGQTINNTLIKKIVQQNPQAFKNNNAGHLIVGTQINFGIENEKKTIATVPVPTSPKKMVTAAPKTTVPSSAKKPAHQQTKPSTSTVKHKPIGRIISSIGRLSATNGQGQVRQLKRNASIYKGDTLTTPDRAHGQIRFVDGALIALRSNTQLRINEYEYSGSSNRESSNEGKSTFELLKGGFRTITGAIGRIRKQNYRVVTSVATIGIRGTHYGLRLCDAATCNNGNQKTSIKEGLYGGVVDGAISIENNSGERIFGNDQYFHVANSDSSPKGLLKPPGIIFDGVELKAKRIKSDKAEQVANKAAKANKDAIRSAKRQIRDNPLADQVVAEAGNLGLGPNKPEFNVGDDINSSPVGATPPNSQQSPAGTVMSFSFMNSEVSGPPGGSQTVIDAIFETTATLVTGNLPSTTIVVSDNGNGIDVPVAAFENSPEGDKSILLNNAQINAVGFNNEFGVLWGRWDGDFRVQDDESSTLEVPIGSLHFMLSDNVTSLAQLINLGPIGSTVIYDAVPGAGTLPTNRVGNVGSYLNATLIVDFLSQQVFDYSIATQHGQTVFMGNALEPVSFPDLFQGEVLELQGNCNGGVCAGGIPLNGAVSVVFVNGSSGPASAAMTTFTLIGGDPITTVGSTGSVLLAR